MERGIGRRGELVFCRITQTGENQREQGRIHINIDNYNTAHTPILKYSRIGYTRQSSHSTLSERVDSTSTRLAHGYLVVARLCFTPHLAVHRGIHTACVRPYVSMSFLRYIAPLFSSVVLTPADFCCVTSTSGITAVTSRSNLIFRRVKRRFYNKLKNVSCEYDQLNG